MLGEVQRVDVLHPIYLPTGNRVGRGKVFYCLECKKQGAL